MLVKLTHIPEQLAKDIYRQFIRTINTFQITFITPPNKIGPCHLMCKLIFHS